MNEPIVIYPCCRHCVHEPGYVHQDLCLAEIFEGKACGDDDE